MSQPRCPSADEWIRKLWYIYTVEYYSAIKKNSFESVLMRWMKLEPIIQTLPLLACEEPMVIFTPGRGLTFLGALVLWTWCQAPSTESLPGPCSFSITCVC